MFGLGRALRRGVRGEDCTGLLDPPDRAARIKLAGFADEDGRFASEDPEVNVLRLQAEDGGNDAGGAAEINLDAEVGGFAADAADADGADGIGCNDEGNEARLGGADDESDCDAVRICRQILQVDGDEAVGDIGRQVEVVFRDFLGAVFSGRPGGDIAVSFDQQIHGRGKAGPFLNVMVADEAEFFLLRVKSGLVVNGAVAEVKDQTRRDVITLGHLDGVAGGDDLTLLIADDEEAVDRALDIAHGDGFCAEVGERQEGEQEKGGAEMRGKDNGSDSDEDLLAIYI